MTTRTKMAALILVSAGLAVGAAACGGGDDGSGATTAEPATTAAPATTSPPPEPDRVAEPGLPAFTAGYQAGLKLNEEPIPPAADAPHGEFKNVYVDQTRATLAPDGTQVFPYPDGAVVVKDGSRDGDAAAVVAVMRKMAGADPEHGDWIYEEFSRTSADADYTLLAEGAVCWGCHVGATETDWVFTTLE